MRNIKNCAKSGFTLGELLITIAIIGVLVAIGLPVLNANLERAREAVDLAHMRQAKSAAAAYFITNPPKEEISRKYYDVRTGAIVSWVNGGAKALPRYGKGTSTNGIGIWTENGLKYHGSLDVRDCLIMVTCDRDGNIYCGWVKPEYALSRNPFTFLAVKTYPDGTRVLYPTRSASSNSNEDYGLFVDLPKGKK